MSTPHPQPPEALEPCPQAPGEFAWLLESLDSEHEYLAAGSRPNNISTTRDPHAAMKFPCRHAAREFFLESLTFPTDPPLTLIAREHGFGLPPSRRTPPAPAPGSAASWRDGIEAAGDLPIFETLRRLHRDACRPGSSRGVTEIKREDIEAIMRALAVACAPAPPTSAASARAAAEAVVVHLLGKVSMSVDAGRADGVERILLKHFPAAPGWQTVTDDPATWAPMRTQLVVVDFDGTMQPARFQGSGDEPFRPIGILAWLPLSSVLPPWPSTPEARP